MALSILLVCLYAFAQNEASVHEDDGISRKWTKLRDMQLLWCHPVVSAGGGRGGGMQSKNGGQREPWRRGGNSTRGFAAPGTHLFLRRVPVDTASRWHTVKLDCGKHHHAATDKRKKTGDFSFQIMVCSTRGRNCCANGFIFYFLRLSFNPLVDL